MADEIKEGGALPESEEDKNSEVEVLPPMLTEKAVTRHHVRDERLASQIRDLGRLGLSKGNVAIAARIGEVVFRKYYLEDYLQGQTEMQRGLATVAVEQAMGGNTPVLIHLLKTKLGWNETQVIEHTGEVRSVVSAKPMTKEEFVQRYLTKDEDDG